MRIVFMGTPDFAVPSLQALADHGYEIAACCCQPDRPSGRGNKMTACPVKVLAQKLEIPVLQFEKIRREGVEILRDLAPDLFVTAAFGQILSQEILDIPKIGTVNVHASLLPRGRGAAPIQWSIINGDRKTGVTTMMTDAGVDTGDILLQRETEIGSDETAGLLSERLSGIGAELLIETLEKLQLGVCPRTPQDAEKATRDPMLQKETGKIDWSKSAVQIERLVRGTNPWPGTWTVCGNEVLKIWRATVTEGRGCPGQILCADAKKGLIVACGEEALRLEEIQTAGAKRMNAGDYLRGHEFPSEIILGQKADS